METITVAYWRGSKFNEFKWNNNTVLPYNVRTQNKIIGTIIGKGFCATCLPSGDTLIIWISKGKPTQS
jgi:hypothetical protein